LIGHFAAARMKKPGQTTNRICVLQDLKWRE
jgi:hypothetical protein